METNQKQDAADYRSFFSTWQRSLCIHIPSIHQIYFSSHQSKIMDSCTTLNPAGLGLFPATLINWILSVSDWFQAQLMFNVDVVVHWFPTGLTCELLEQNYVVLTSVCTFTGYNQFQIFLSKIWHKTVLRPYFQSLF